ncbi:hypothetical protein MsAg5_06340 [Methanosarcinaceae archaeon Ag5]|uniref:Uncharacterized protein n=1 Tax=Methanolapillus africanus TaxID=3028297 RepID=A0AAE4MKF7_9EURY|nr:hypothetical protein [Methanosarcinaceae archaeon Ag5]
MIVKSQMIFLFLIFSLLIFFSIIFFYHFFSIIFIWYFFLFKNLFLFYFEIRSVRRVSIQKLLIIYAKMSIISIIYLYLKKIKLFV